MLYSEVRNEILTLGFENSDVLLDDDYKALFRDGINKALDFINADFPLIQTFDISLDGTSEDFEEVILTDISDFHSFVDAKIKREVNGRLTILPFADFQIAHDTIMYISPKVEGTVIVYYRGMFTPVTTTTTDATVITIDKKAEKLLPLLAAYYIWNDDDAEKSAKWFNEYEDKRNLILARTQPAKPFTFTGGV